MHNVRLSPPSTNPDVTHYMHQGEIWVAANSGGVSTFSAPDPRTWRGPVWKAPANSPIPQGLIVWEDDPGHWLWSPAADMRLAEYCQALAKANGLFS
jgi:hypothetical protein